MKTLTTTRLVIRPLTEADFPAIAAMDSDPEVMRYLALNSAVPTYEKALQQVPEILDMPCPEGCGTWVITARQEGTFIGWVWLAYREGSSDIDFGYRLGKGCWGNGHATEAGQRVVDHAFRDLELSHLTAVIHPQNMRSIRVVKKIGFKRSGIEEVFDIFLNRYVLTRECYVEHFVGYS